MKMCKSVSKKTCEFENVKNEKINIRIAKGCVSVAFSLGEGRDGASLNNKMTAA